MTWTAIYSYSVASYEGSTVKIRANATDPLIVPAVLTIIISLALRVHLETALKAYPKTKIAATRDMMQISSSRPKKDNEIW